MAGVAGFALSLLAAPSYAGFQYVPPQAAPATAPNAPVAPVTPEGADSSMTPPPQATPEAAIPQPAPAVSPEAPHTLVIPAKDLPAMKPQSQPKMIQSAPQAHPVLKTLTVTSPAQKTPAEVTPMPIPAEETANAAPKSIEPKPVLQKPAAQNSLSESDINWNPAASQVRDLSDSTPATTQPVQIETPPPALVESAPIASEKTLSSPKVIMPPDAPIKAASAVPNSEKLVINPFPDVSHDNNGGASKAAPSDDDESMPPESADMKSAASVPAAEPTSDGTSSAKIQGFGSDMPLALALQQIAPPSYAVAYDQGVNPGARVSWEGHGKAWDQVITDMLQPMNLQAEVQGNVVRISRIDGAANPEQTPPATTEKEIGKQSAAEPVTEKSAVVASKQASAPVKFSNNDLRRNAIRDPGASPSEQPASVLMNIESSSGGPEKAAQSDAGVKPLLEDAR